MPAADWQDPARWPEDLRDAFANLPEASRRVVALSGGLDSVFLLHCLAGLTRSDTTPLHAIHINHGLQSAAGDWEAWCRELCDSLSIPLTTDRLTLDAEAPDLEATARSARYRIFRDAMTDGDLLLMAHHGDDQAETVLLRLLRGSGIRGLAGMPRTRALGPGQLHRPLLPLTRERIESLARDWGLHWCEDHSNRDRRFDRNYLRHEIMPNLTARWPRAVARINRSADHCRDADAMLDELAEQDRHLHGMNEGLRVSALHKLPPHRQRQLLRHALRQNNLQPPGETQLTEGLTALLHAAEDRAPELRGPDYRLRRYRDRIWCLPEGIVDSPPSPAGWQPGATLPWGPTRLHSRLETGPGLLADTGTALRVTRRQGGEQIQAGPDRPRRALKKWLQEQAIPPWERELLPLLWHGEELVAVGDYWIAPAWRTAHDQQGWALDWERPWHRI